MLQLMYNVCDTSINMLVIILLTFFLYVQLL